uniref:Probable RNA-binding protein EIF1AD n=1 Tax=Glossina palpalis gambiensis TaxID=67801 RepID=A0A1B0C7D2_9MUSC
MIQDSKDGQQIVRIIASRGNNLDEVETADTETENFLVVTRPTKFRKTVRVKRGDVVLVKPSEDCDKVKAESCKILTAEHIKKYKAGIWPESFKRDDNVPNGRCASNYVKESCDENVEDFEEKFSEPCHFISE